MEDKEIRERVTRPMTLKNGQPVTWGVLAAGLVGLVDIVRCIYHQPRYVPNESESDNEGQDVPCCMEGTSLRYTYPSLPSPGVYVLLFISAEVRIARALHHFAFYVEHQLEQIIAQELNGWVHFTMIL